MTYGLTRVYGAGVDHTSSTRKNPSRRFWASGRRRTATAALISVFLSLVFAAAATAWRNPTGHERRAITLVAVTAPHAGTARVHVSDIRVSTVGPWASATVTIYFGKTPDSATDILREHDGQWRNASLGTAGEWCVMPAKDQRNLGFPSSYPC